MPSVPLCTTHVSRVARLTSLLDVRRSLVHVEANFTVSNVKLESSGEYKTVIMAKHGPSK